VCVCVCVWMDGWMDGWMGGCVWGGTCSCVVMIYQPLPAPNNPNKTLTQQTTTQPTNQPKKARATNHNQPPNHPTTHPTKPNTQEHPVPEERRWGAGGGAHPGAVAALPAGRVAPPQGPQRGVVALPLDFVWVWGVGGRSRGSGWLGGSLFGWFMDLEGGCVCLCVLSGSMRGR
jgi:hypothetical protein